MLMLHLHPFVAPPRLQQQSALSSRGRANLGQLSRCLRLDLAISWAIQRKQSLETRECLTEMEGKITAMTIVVPHS